MNRSHDYYGDYHGDHQRKGSKDREMSGHRDRRNGDRDRDYQGDRDRTAKRYREERHGSKESAGIKDRHYNNYSNDDLSYEYDYEELELLASANTRGSHSEQPRRKPSPIAAVGVAHGSHARSPRALNGREKEPSKEYGGLDRAHWLEAAENGELDVYTCMALTNLSTNTSDTKRLIPKVIGCLFVQMVAPALLLAIEIETMMGKGLSLKPINNELKFRTIGAIMLLYTLSRVYQNCVDECRAMMLDFAFSMGLSCGHCWPLLLGEIAHMTVGVVLMLSMYISFINIDAGTELVFNAVALNFLGSIHAEFVNSKTHADACQNFKDITTPFREVMKGSRFSCSAKLIGGSMFLLRISLVLLGSILSTAFLFSPDREDESNTVILPFKLSFSIPGLF